MSEITEASSSFNGLYISPSPQNPNAPTGSALAAGESPKANFPMEISIESLIPHVPKRQNPLEGPTPPLPTPRYTMENGLNFGRIACPSQMPVFGRKIKVPRGLPVAGDPVEFEFASEKQCKLPMSPSEAIFTAGRAIKPLRKSRGLLAKGPEISFADTSVSGEVIFGAAGTSGLDGGDKIIEEHEDEVAGAPSEGLASSLSLAIKTPLPDDDEHYPEDVSFTLSLALNTPLPADTESDSECPWPTPEIGVEPSLQVDDTESLLEAPQDAVSTSSPDSSISTKVIFTAGKPIKPARQPRALFSKSPEMAFADVSVSPEVVFGSVAGGGLYAVEEFVAEPENKVITLKTPVTPSGISSEDLTLSLSLALKTPLPDDDEPYSEDAPPTLSDGTELGYQGPQSAPETESSVEGDDDNRFPLDTLQDVVGAISPDSIISIEMLDASAADWCSGGEHDMGPGNELEEAKGARRESQSQDIQEETNLATETIPTITESTPGPKIPLYDAGPCPEGVSLALSLVANTPLPVDTESNSELSLLIPETEPPLEPSCGDKSQPEASEDALIARSLESTASANGIFTVRKPVRPLRQRRSPLCKKPDIAFINTLVSQKVVFGGALARGPGDEHKSADNVVDEPRSDINSAGAPGITTEGGTNKAFSVRAVSPGSSSKDLDDTFSLALETPLPDGDGPCPEDASHTLLHALNTPLPTGTGFGTNDDNNPPLKFPQDVVISGPPDNHVPAEPTSTAKLMEPLCKGCALLAKMPEIPSANASVSWEVISGGAGACGHDGGDQLVDKLEEKHTTFKTQIASSNAGPEDLPRYLSITVKVPLPDDVNICSEDASLALSLALNALSASARFGSEQHLSTPETGSPVEADSKLLLEPPQEAVIEGSPDSTVSVGSLAPWVPNWSLEDKSGMSTGHEEEQLWVEGGHNSQAIQEPNSTAEAIPVLTESTHHFKAPLLHDAETCSEGALLDLSLAANTPLPVDTEFDYESLPDLKIKPPLRANSGNTLLAEIPQEFLITGSPGGAVLTEDILAAGKSIKPLSPPPGLLAEKPEKAFPNASVPPGAMPSSVGAGGCTDVDQAIEGLEDGVFTFETETVSSSISSKDLTGSLSLDVKTPFPDDDVLYSEDESLTQPPAPHTSLLLGPGSGSESSVLTPETESPPRAEEEIEPFLEIHQAGRIAGPSDRAISTEVILTAGKPIKQLCRPHSPSPKEPEIACASALVPPEHIHGNVSLPLSLALDTPLPIDHEPDFEHPLSNIEIESLPEAEEGHKPLLEVLQGAVIANPPDIAILMGESAIGVPSGRSNYREAQEPKDIGSGNEQNRLENTHPYSPPIPVEDLISAPESTRTTAGSTFDLLTAHEKTQVSTPETYGQCEVPKNAAVTPSATTLDLHSPNTSICGVSSSTLSPPHTSTDNDTEESGPIPAGFGGTKSEFDITDMFVGIFKEVGVVDLALSTGILAGTAQLPSRGLAAGKNEAAAPSVDARSEVVTPTSETEKERKGTAVQKVLTKLGKFSVRKSVVKLFNVLARGG